MNSKNFGEMNENATVSDNCQQDGVNDTQNTEQQKDDEKYNNDNLQESESKNCFEEDKYMNIDETIDNGSVDSDNNDNHKDESDKNNTQRNIYQIDFTEETDSKEDEKPETTKKSTSWPTWFVVTVAVCFAVIGMCVGGISRNTKSSSQQQTITAEIQTAENEDEAEEDSSSILEEIAETLQDEESEESTESTLYTSAADVAEVVMPSVVSVYSNYTENYNYYGQIFSTDETSTGTGFIIAINEEDNELLILTNNHVVEDADSLQVKFIDDETSSALIKGTNADLDIAVVSVSLDNISETTMNSISVAMLGDSDNIRIGDDVIAIGNALGYGQSVTKGIVSAVGRTIESDDISGEFIQTDAAINMGNSGGPLVDMNGYVIGITSSKIGGTTVEGMGYAIPISDVIDVIEELMTLETRDTVSESERGYLGITGVTVTESVSEAYDMPEGAYVAGVIDGGAAEKAGVQKGDIITKFDGRTVSGMEELQEILSYYMAGETVVMEVERINSFGEYTTVEIEITLANYSILEDY